MTPVEAFLTAHGHPNAPIYFEQSTATVPLAAAALGVEPGRIAKSLALVQKEGVAVLVTCGTARLSNQKYKAQFGCKAKMCSPEETLGATGHPVGGVCPFALPQGMPVFLDRSLLGYDSVFPAAGTPNSAVACTPDALAALTGGTWVDVVQDPAPGE